MFGQSEKLAPRRYSPRPLPNRLLLRHRARGHHLLLAMTNGPDPKAAWISGRPIIWWLYRALRSAAFNAQQTAPPGRTLPQRTPPLRSNVSAFLSPHLGNGGQLPDIGLLARCA